MFISPVERLVAFRLRIPPHTDGQDVRIGSAFQGGEIKFQSLNFALLILQAPASYGREGSQTEIALLILQVLIAAQNFLPLAIVVFRHDDTRYDSSRQIVFRRLWHNVGHKKLLLAILSEVAEG